MPLGFDIKRRDDLLDITIQGIERDEIGIVLLSLGFIRAQRAKHAEIAKALEPIDDFLKAARAE